MGRAVALLESVGAQAMPNYVLLGSQGIKGNPVGAEAHFVGGMMFTAATVETPTGVAVRTTADPAGPPAFLRQPLKLGPRPRVLVADTGLCTTTSRSGGLAPAHSELAGVAIHSDWARDDADPLVIDDEDEPDGDGLGYLDFEAGPCGCVHLVPGGEKALGEFFPAPRGHPEAMHEHDRRIAQSGPFDRTR